MKTFGLRTLRILSLIVLAALGTIALTRWAPGYFSDAREMDSAYGDQARSELKVQEARQGTMARLMGDSLAGWMHGDFGESRQYGVAVSELIAARYRVTGRLLLTSLGSGWLVACCLAVLLSARRARMGEAMLATLTAVLLAVPIGAMATACVMTNTGGPFLVLATVVAVRDFKLMYRVVAEARKAPHLVYARAQGLTPVRITLVHLLPPLGRQVLALAVMSLLTALAAIVPVEVIFDVPGLGQLAWAAAMNRDLPVLLGVTVLMAAAIGLASMMAHPFEREFAA